MNLAILRGFVGKDPETRYTPDGKPVCAFSLATNSTFNNKQGERVQKTEWHRIVTFNKMAEICSQHVKKGSELLIRGEIQTRNYDDKDGIKRYVTEIHIPMFGGSVEFIGSNGNGKSAPSKQDAPANEPYNPPFPSDDSEDVPF